MAHDSYLINLASPDETLRRRSIESFVAETEPGAKPAPTALAGFTINSAYVNHLDHLTGSIEVGKRADLAVLDRDVFANPVEEIADASVVLTFVDGERVHDAERPA